MEIIDFEKRGNQVRFYLGDSTKDYGGDDWNDSPYEHNAGLVYDEYVLGHIDVVFPFDWMVLEPCDGAYNSCWCKDDFKRRKTPCIVAVPETEWRGEDEYVWRDDSYIMWVGCQNAIKFYYGDDVDEVIKKNLDIKGKFYDDTVFVI